MKMHLHLNNRYEFLLMTSLSFTIKHSIIINYINDLRAKNYSEHHQCLLSVITVNCPSLSTHQL